MENKVYEGLCVWFSPKRGYGFIQWHKDGVKQNDMFMHFSDLAMEGFKTINANQKVSFEIGSNKNGDPKAINIKLLNDEKKTE
jgi:CspA family cold shock protein